MNRPFEPGGRPLRGWSDGDLTALAREIGALLAGWSAAWGLPAPAARARGATPCDLPVAAPGPALGDGAWLRLSGEVGQAWCAVWFPGDAAAPLTRALVRRARADLHARLARVVGVAGQGDAGGDAPPDQDTWERFRREALRPWSGALVVEAGTGQDGVAVLLDGALVGRLLVGPKHAARAAHGAHGAHGAQAAVVPTGVPQTGAPPANDHAIPSTLASATEPANRSTGRHAAPLVSVPAALARHRLRVAAWLDPVELSLADLQSLRPGDVVPLSHRLDAPLQVRVGAALPWCAGWLGRHAGQRALALISPSTPTRNSP